MLIKKIPKINIIAHRGYWINAEEKNTKLAFIRALKNGFGIETDFRDLNGELVISHDPAKNGAMKASEFAELYLQYDVSSPIAINIKSDGLYEYISRLIEDAKFKSAFAFDMSVPDMRGYLKKHIHTYTRLSEYESSPAFFEACKGVWLDAFENEWYREDTIISLLKSNKEVAIVSPELHGRPHLPIWEMLKINNLHCDNSLSICTDFPMHAKEYFYGQD